MNISKLGTLRAAIEADTGGLHTSISGAKADFKSFGERVPGYVKPVSLALLGMGVATATALSGLVLSAGKMGDELDKMSLRTGVAVEDLSGLSYAAKISGTDMTAMETSIRFLNRRMDESSKGIGIAKEAFEKLGISITDSEGKMRPSIDVMKEVADGIVRLESESEKGATAMDIFGARSGPQLLPLLKQGSAGIEELTDKAAELGLIISDKAAKASAEFTDRLTDVKDSARIAGFELGSVFLPAITDLLEKATGLVGRFNKLDEGTQRMVGWGTAGGAALATITGGAGLLLTQLPKMAKGWELLRASSVPHIAAIGAAVLAVGWAANETYKAIRDWRDGTTAAEKRVHKLTHTASKQVEALDMLSEKFNELRAAGIDPMNVSVGLLGVDLDKLNKLLDTNVQETANATELANSLAKIIKRAQGRVKELREEEDGATESTKDLDAAMGEFQKTLKKGETEWGNIAKAFNAYTAITGEGYGANTLQAIAYYEEVKAGSLKTVEAERFVTRTIGDLKKKHFAEAGFLERGYTFEHIEESGKRALVDEDYLQRISRNHQRRLDSATDTMTKETGLIQKHFDWSVQAAEIRSQKEIRIRKDQYAAELQARESLELAIDHIDERAFLMAQEDDERQYELKNRSFEEDQRLAGEREKLQAKFLSSATANVKSELDLQSAFTKKTKTQLGEAYQGAMELVQRVYDDYAPYYQKFNFDIVELEKWRADQIQAIDKQLSKTRIKELDDYYVSYDEKVRSHEELFGGAKSGLLRGRSIYEGMDPEYRQRLNYGLAQQVFFPEEATPAQQAPSAAPAVESYYGAGSPGGSEIHIHIENLYGGDEASANAFAEEVGRRIREQAYQQ